MLWVLYEFRKFTKWTEIEHARFSALSLFHKVHFLCSRICFMMQFDVNILPHW